MRGAFLKHAGWRYTASPSGASSPGAASPHGISSRGVPFLFHLPGQSEFARASRFCSAKRLDAATRRGRCAPGRCGGPSSDMQAGNVLLRRPGRSAGMPHLPTGFHPAGSPSFFICPGKVNLSGHQGFAPQNTWTPQSGGGAPRPGDAGGLPQTCRLAIYCFAVLGVLPGCRISQRMAPVRRAWRSMSTPYRSAIRSTMSRNSA